MGSSEPKSDAESGQTGRFLLVIGGELRIERQEWTMSDYSV